MEVNTHFIPQNVAPQNAYQIGVYNKRGKKIGYIPLGNLALPNVGRKLYSFGALSDIHLGSTDSDTDFERALTYYNEVEKVDLICVCGDLTNFGRVDEYQHYKDMVDAYSPNTPVRAITGNHDCSERVDPNMTWCPETAITLDNNAIVPYTGNPLFYSFEQGNDVFVMVGNRRWEYGYANDDPFSVEELQWLYDTLESNRNKREFLIEHVLAYESSGDALGLYPHTKLANKTESKAFKSLLQHYHNVIWMHGHSHMRFNLQKYSFMANYDNVFGCHSVHIPSITIPRQVNQNWSEMETYTEGSEGYVVDVYENGIHLRGRDFVKEEFLPIASYWLDTTLQTIPANTYTDSTGTIKT